MWLGGVFMIFDNIKAYRKNNLNDETGWDYIDNDFQNELNKKILDFYNTSRKNKSLLCEIYDVFNSCRYSFILRSKELQNYYIANALFYNEVEQNELLDTIANYMFECFAEFVNEKFDPNKINKNGEKNDNFISYYSKFAPKIVKNKLRQEFSEFNIPPGVYRVISKLLRIRSDYYSNNYKYPDNKTMAEIFNASVRDKKQKLDENKIKDLMLIIGELNPVRIDKTDDDEDESKAIDIVDPVDVFYQTDTNFHEYEMLSDFADAFAAMLNHEEFLKHYNNNLKKTSSERYNYFKMFYTCDTIKYLKKLPQLQNFLLLRNNKIINGCDDHFFKYVLLCDKNSIITDLHEIINLKFKKFKDLKVNVFKDEDLDVPISVVEQKTGKKVGMLKLKNEKLIFTSYKINEKTGCQRLTANIIEKEQPLVSQKISDYQKYNYEFLHNILEKYAREKYE